MMKSGPIDQWKQSTPTDRRGIVLVVVMVVVVMISLAGFGFVASMANENKSVHLRGEQLQMENAIASAEEFLKQYVQRSSPAESSNSSSSTSNLMTSPQQTEVDDEALMRGIVVADEDGPHSRVRFTVMAPRYDATGFSPWQYGIERESARLDLRALMTWEAERPGTGRKALMALPGMTESIADALLDWMDADNAPRSSGVEQEFYASLNPSYPPRNGIPDSLEELLLVKGVTRSLLFGRDTNQNHRLDPDELSSTNSSAQRDPAGEKQLPWTELLTLYSGEKNQSRARQPRINLNQPNLADLHRQLAIAFDARLANYVVLCRQNGLSGGIGPAADAGTIKPNFTLPPKYQFRSPLDLLQSRVQVAVPGAAVTTVISPLPTEREKLDEMLAMLYDQVTVVNSPVLRGQVNVNLASAVVLGMIPGMEKALSEQIVTARSTGVKGDAKHEKHPCWLLTEGLVNLEKMKELLPYLTVGGDVYRTQIVAFSETSRLSQRVEVVLDASRLPARRVFWKDLQVLGRGYPWDVLDTPGGISNEQSGAIDASVGN